MPMMDRRRTLASLLAGLLSACGFRSIPPTATPLAQPSAVPPTPTLVPTNELPSATPVIPVLVSPQRAIPLVPLQVTIQAAGMQGAAAKLVFTDTRGRNAGLYEVVLGEAATQIEVIPRAGLGPQRAELFINGQARVVADPLFTVEAETSIATGQQRFDVLYPRLRGFMQQGRLSYTLDGARVAGYRSPDNPLLWLRDHTYQARGFCYFEKDLTSLIEHFRAAQQPDGSLPDWLPNKALGVLKPGRKEVEADLEFLFVQAVVEAWQVTGDDAWLKQNLQAMRSAIDYSTSNPLRWDSTLGLVKRPYTIDMWDFSYGPTTLDPTNGRPAPRHWIDDATIWGIFHGDNTGLAQALNLLALAEERVGDSQEVQRRRDQSDELMQRLMDLSWNGRFFTHFVPLQPFEPAGVDASEQLSLSNTYALNRNVLRSQQGRTIVNEYFQRGEKRDPVAVFAEWYSIDPPFPAGSYGLAGRPGEKPGEYVNGGLMPLVGGELARGAFQYGAERYGFAILERYFFLIDTTNATYLWYYPAGNPGISGVDTVPTDGWGASAMLAALIEGAAGIENRGVSYSTTRLSPRWAATADVRSARATARYAASDGYAAYHWELSDGMLRIQFASAGDATELRLLLPDVVTKVSSVTLDAAPVTYEVRNVLGSKYVFVDAATGNGDVMVRW